MLIIIITIVLFLALGVLFINGKASFLIAGYNTMPAEEQQRYDIESLAKFMGKIMFSVSGGLVLIMLSEMVDAVALSVVGTILIVASSIFALVYTNTKNRFRKDRS